MTDRLVHPNHLTLALPRLLTPSTSSTPIVQDFGDSAVRAVGDAVKRGLSQMVDDMSSGVLRPDLLDSEAEYDGRSVEEGSAAIPLDSESRAEEEYTRRGPRGPISMPSELQSSLRREGAYPASSEVSGLSDPAFRFKGQFASSSIQGSDAGVRRRDVGALNAQRSYA